MAGAIYDEGMRGLFLWRANRRVGFTLIELLIVVAIISLLVGVLLPSLHNARESARSVVCQTNSRSWGHGLHDLARETGAFANDGGNIGGLPDLNSATAKRKYWINIVPPRLNFPPYWQLAERGELPMYGSNVAGLYMCPSDTKSPGDSDGTGKTIPYDAANGLKFYLNYIYCNKFTGSNNKPPSLSEISFPSSTVLVFERRCDNSTTELPKVEAVLQQANNVAGLAYTEAVRSTYFSKALGVCRGNWEIASGRHSIGSNVAFCDGSARRVPFYQLQLTDPANSVNHNTSVFVWAPLRDVAK